MDRLPWWGLLSSTAAPVLLVGGWTVAAGLQPASYDARRDTISALAAHGATDRWLMTGAFVGVGVSHVVTAFALRGFGRPGRLVLAGGGVATLGVAAFPLPAGGGGSVAHTAVAAVAFGALASWPALAVRREGWAAARPVVGAVATAALLVALAGFAVELSSGGSRVGLTERVAAATQSLWPLAVAVASRRRR